MISINHKQQITNSQSTIEKRQDILAREAMDWLTVEVTNNHIHINCNTPNPIHAREPNRPVTGPG